MGTLFNQEKMGKRRKGFQDVCIHLINILRGKKDGKGSYYALIPGGRRSKKGISKGKGRGDPWQWRQVGTFPRNRGEISGAAEGTKVNE